MARRVLQALLGLAVSVAFGWLALRNISLSEVGDALREARYVWLLPALAALGVAVWMRAERWRSLFPPAERPDTGPTFWALIIGLFFNNVLPARAGEVARVLALSRETGIPKTHCLVTVGVERVFDLASLAIVLMLLAPTLPSTGFVHQLTVAAVIIVLLTVLLVVALSIRPLRPRAVRLIHRLPVLGGARAARTERSLALGLSPLRRASLAIPVALWSVGSWAVLGLSNWFVLQAFPPVHAPWHAAFLALVTTNLAQVVPSTAAALGVFEAAARAALTAYGVPAALALSYGLVLHAVNLIPSLVLGAVALGRLGLTGRELLHPEPKGG